MITDEAILIHKLKYGETSAILTVYSKQYGIIKGLFKGAYVNKNKAVVQLGNILSISKKYHSIDKLGLINIELKESYLSSIMPDNKKLYLLLSICDIMYKFLPAFEDDINFYNLTKNTIISFCSSEHNEKYYINWEMRLLDKIGYGLDITKCTVTGEKDDLFYISPKTAKAVTKDIGDKYKNKLFIIPNYWLNTDINNPTKEELLNALNILEFFLKKFSEDHNLKLPRSRLMLTNML